MATNTTIQAINNAVPNVGLDTPHPEEPTRKLLNAILRDYLQAIESLENDTVTKSQIVQVFGDSQTAVISQDALTDYLSNLSFLQLADTPYVYAGSIGKFIRVNAAGDGLEFFELGAAAISNSFNDLSDKPDFDSIPQVITAADFASLPATGDITRTYLTLDDGKLYYWSGSAYVVFTNDTATWAGIGGNIGDNAALTSALNDKADASDVALKSTSIYAGAGLIGGGDLSDDRTLNVDIGTGAGQVMAGDDSRVANLEDGAYAQIGIDIAPLGQDGLVPPAHLPAQFSGDYDDLSGKPALGTVAPLDVDTDADLAANSDALIPSQKAVKAYVDGQVTLKPWAPDGLMPRTVSTDGWPLNNFTILIEIETTALGQTILDASANYIDRRFSLGTVNIDGDPKLRLSRGTVRDESTDIIPFGVHKYLIVRQSDNTTQVYVDDIQRITGPAFNITSWPALAGIGALNTGYPSTPNPATKFKVLSGVYTDFEAADSVTGANLIVELLPQIVYPDNATSNIFEITGTPTPLQWDELGGTVVNGDLVAFDSAGVPFVVNVTEPEEITAAQVKQLYESNPDTNAFTDADVVKLANATDKTLPINWLEVSTPTFIIEPEHAGMSLWVTVDCVITVTDHIILPNGFNCEIFKADSSLIVSVGTSGSDTIRDGKSVIVSDASVFKSPTAGVIGLVGDIS